MLRASAGARVSPPPLLLALCTGLCVPESSAGMTRLLAPPWAQPVSPVLGVDGMCSLVLSGGGVSPLSSVGTYCVPTRDGEDVCPRPPGGMV